MSYQVLARKWRPRDFTELVGQEHVQRALVNALDNDRLHHAYLFTGTRGVGKTTIARILARSLNCETGVTSTPCGKCSACEEINSGRFVDLLEVDAASRTKVEDTRELLENVQYAPTRGRYKVYLIDEVHMLSGHSFNALLKTLEEPPPHVKFLLATTDPQKLPVTILSRCLQFNLKSLSPPQIIGQLEKILREESIGAESGAVRQIALAACGSMRDALSLLDQAIAFGGGDLQEAEVRSMLGTIDRDVVYRLLEALAGADAARVLAEIQTADAFTPDYAALLADIVSVLQRIALAQTVPDAIDDTYGDRDVVLALADKLSAEDVQLYYQIALIGRRDLPLSPEPRGGFEMIMLRMLAFRPVAGERAASPAVPEPAAGTRIERSAARAAARTNAAPAASSAPPAAADAAGWAGIVEALPLKGMVREMALNCAFHGMQDDVVSLTMDPAHKHLLSPSRTRQLEEKLVAYYRRQVHVKIASEGPLEKETPARKRTREQDERQQQAVASIENDANIKAITDTFGGTVSTDSIRPRER
ncbi:MAG TPA: DNA polymerase III subunit gamma/tau [Gammaproteobacteria bacterium]|nr:DNA polymerase III subunit gamma/tau [Gammaproteobacteria bacterium]